jgi:hypothetical protein
MSIEQAVQRAAEGEGVIGMDYVKEVSTPEIYQWDPDDKLSEPWSIQTATAIRNCRRSGFGSLLTITD